jgi:Kef-type K+ transport system membrane component KefB
MAFNFTTTTFIVDLALLLAASVIAGEIANRLGQAALVGQLLVGVILGPTLFGQENLLGQFTGFFSNPSSPTSSLPAELTGIQTLATVFILFLAGLDIVPEQVYKMGLKTAGFGIVVFAVPFVVTSAVAYLFFPSFSTTTDLFIALTLSITALPVMGIMLLEFGLLHARIGRLLMNTALVNELVAVSVFAVLLDFENSNTSGFVAVTIAAVSVGLFIATMLAIHMSLRVLATTHWWGGFRARYQSGWKSREGRFAVLMVMVLGASLYSQYLGLTFVVGAFYAGLLVTKESAGPEMHRSFSTVFDAISWGFFIPLFFAFVGVEMNLRLLSTPWLVFEFVALLGVALLSKLLTGYGISQSFGWKKADAQAIGYLVASRGAVELAMAVTLLQLGVFNTEIFTIVAGVGLITTIVAPIGALRAWETDPASRSDLYERVPSLRPGAERTRAFRPSLIFTHVPEAGEAPSSWLVPPEREGYKGYDDPPPLPGKHDEDDPS